MPDTTTLAAQMKALEHTYRRHLPARSWAVVRLDGRAFHSYTRGLQRPFDAQFAADMDATAATVTAEVAGASFAYVCSDEISILFSDLAAEHTQMWFGGVVDKIVSITAALATARFNQLRPSSHPEAGPALFDSRVFTLPTREDVAGYFIWRQRDCTKNAVSMAAQATFSHKSLQGQHTGVLRERLLHEAGIDFETYPAGFRNGRVVVRREVPDTVTWMHKKTGEISTADVVRSVWTPEPATPFGTRPDPAPALLDLIPTGN